MAPFVLRTKNRICGAGHRGFQAKTASLVPEL
jgi:hypothetical protein